MITTVQNCLVATRLLANARQSLNDPQAQLPSLHILINRNILNVANAAQVARKLLLHEHRSHANNGIRLFCDDDDSVIRVIA